MTSLATTTDVVIPSKARNLLFLADQHELLSHHTPLKFHGPSCLLIARNAYQCFAPQQAKIQALIKIYVRLVICPIYSVVKYRPRELTSTHPPQQVWVLLTLRPCGPKNSSQPNVRRQQSLTPNIRLNGGADRDRTGGLLVANQALSQLSYSPSPQSPVPSCQLPVKTTGNWPLATGH